MNFAKFLKTPSLQNTFRATFSACISFCYNNFVKLFMLVIVLLSETLMMSTSTMTIRIGLFNSNLWKQFSLPLQSSSLTWQRIFSNLRTHIIQLIIVIKESEVVVQKCFVKTMFLQISKNSHEDTCARISFLLEISNFNCNVLLWILRNFEKYLFLISRIY